MDQRRRENRFKPNQIVAVRVLGWTPAPLIQATILDLSADGMRLRSKVPVPFGASVDIELGTSVAHGRVSRCEPAQDYYELGLHIEALEKS